MRLTPQLDCGIMGGRDGDHAKMEHLTLWPHFLTLPCGQLSFSWLELAPPQRYMARASWLAGEGARLLARATQRRGVAGAESWANADG